MSKKVTVPMLTHQNVRIKTITRDGTDYGEIKLKGAGLISRAADIILPHASYQVTCGRQSAIFSDSVSMLMFMLALAEYRTIVSLDDHPSKIGLLSENVVIELGIPSHIQPIPASELFNITGYTNQHPREVGAAILMAAYDVKNPIFNELRLVPYALMISDKHGSARQSVSLAQWLEKLIFSNVVVKIDDLMKKLTE